MSAGLPGMEVEADLGAESEERAAELPTLDAVERQQVLIEWNDTAATAARPTVVELFAAQVVQGPDAVALVGTGASAGIAWSYRELDQRSNRLARYLRRLGVGPEVRVAVGLERSPEMVMSLL